MDSMVTARPAGQAQSGLTRSHAPPARGLFTCRDPGPRDAAEGRGLPVGKSAAQQQPQGEEAGQVRAQAAQPRLQPGRACARALGWREPCPAGQLAVGHVPDSWLGCGCPSDALARSCCQVHRLVGRPGCALLGGPGLGGAGAQGLLQGCCPACGKQAGGLMARTIMALPVSQSLCCFLCCRRRPGLKPERGSEALPAVQLAPRRQSEPGARRAASPAACRLWPADAAEDVLGGMSPGSSRPGHVSRAARGCAAPGTGCSCWPGAACTAPATQPTRRTAAGLAGPPLRLWGRQRPLQGCTSPPRSGPPPARTWSSSSLHDCCATCGRQPSRSRTTRHASCVPCAGHAGRDADWCAPVQWSLRGLEGAALKSEKERCHERGALRMRDLCAPLLCRPSRTAAHARATPLTRCPQVLCQRRPVHQVRPARGPAGPHAARGVRQGHEEEHAGGPLGCPAAAVASAPPHPWTQEPCACAGGLPCVLLPAGQGHRGAGPGPAPGNSFPQL